DEADVILDFKVGVDLIALSAPGGFGATSDVAFVDAEDLGGDDDDTAVVVIDTGEILALVQDVEVNEIGLSDVTLIG
ncbi:MAG: hypothetical protein MI923_11050, partial [Phycisphaerales bacterium]|nr:hypothetical protein [Phycisphaerales bacterium]